MNEQRRDILDLLALTQLKPEQLDALIEHLDEMTVEVDQADAKVRVFCG